jgi:ribosome-associated toxin RatA of RatAB toxin-antitoxin module
MNERIWQSIIFFSSIMLIGGILLNFPQFSMAKVTKLISEQEQISLDSGNVILLGKNGQYIGKIIINASFEKVWNVLTDYGSFPKFLPTVTSVKVLESNDNRKVYEQTNAVQILFFSQISKVIIAVNELYPLLINFQMREGDSIKSLKGSWQIESLSNDRVLLTNQVNIEPNSSAPRDLFFNIYSENLIKTLIALKQETERRKSP